MVSDAFRVKVNEQIEFSVLYHVGAHNLYLPGDLGSRHLFLVVFR